MNWYRRYVFAVFQDTRWTIAPEFNMDQKYLFRRGFRVGNDVYTFIAQRKMDVPNTWEVTFALGGGMNARYELTDKKTALQVMSAVRQIFQEFVKAKKPASILFEAEGERVSLYQKMVERYIAQQGYEAKTQDIESYTDTTETPQSVMTRKWILDKLDKPDLPSQTSQPVKSGWYAKYLKQCLAQHGEYWIQGSGVVTSADTNVDDTGHEGHVVSAILSQHFDSNSEYGPNLYNETDRISFISQHRQEFLNAFLEDGRITQEDLTNMAEWTDAAISAQATDYDFYDIAGMTQDEINAVTGKTDARTYAMKVWGWKRVQSTVINTWSLTPRDMDIIADGLYDIYNDDAEMYTYTIEVFSENKKYDDVPWEIISEKNFVSLRNLASL